MFNMFDLVISSHPHIPRYLYTCLYPCIVTSLHLCVRVYLLVSLHPCILISLGSCVLASNLVLSHPLILGLVYFVCLLVSSHPHVLISLSCSVHTCLGNWNQIKTMVLTQKKVFMETNNGSTNFVTKYYIYNEN